MLLGGQTEVEIRFTFTLMEETKILVSEFMMLGLAQSKRIGICTLYGMMVSLIWQFVPCTTPHKSSFNKLPFSLCEKWNLPA